MFTVMGAYSKTILSYSEKCLHCGLAGVEVAAHLKKNFGKAWLISIVLCVIALLMGVMHIY